MAQPIGHRQKLGDSHAGQTGAVVFFSNPLMSDIQSDWSPIHDAAYNGHALSLQKLIAQGACVNLATLDRVSPLHVACLQGNTACAKMLIDNGANLNSPTVEQTTALSEACDLGHVACVTLLLQHGAVPQGSCLSDSPIHRAAAKGHLECIETLAHHGADVNHNVDQSVSPLYTASTNQHLSTVRRLLQLGASVNSSENGESPLHAAARSSSPELVSVLLDHGADCSSRNAQGKLPVDLAPPNSLVEKLLSQRGESTSLPHAS
ncbi:ankyrin repeat and SOCS box protein 9-like [Osmerus mordax]|uniref:ankyrin repeat and SOCS box protein 9-like n=1 Tax=Osmerus mordax TaxID=8014 RepID=UPI00350F8C68